MNGTFYEQIGGVAGIFEGWTVCERTVVLCALLRRVPWSNLKLLKRAIEAALAHHATAESQRLEAEANDAVLLAQIVKTGDEEEAPLDLEEQLKKLLTYLPLMKPANEQAKEVYLMAVPGLVQRCVDTSRHTDECQQLLSYLLIHPGLTSHDRRSLSQWLRYLENHISGNSNKEMWQQRVETPLGASKTSLTSANGVFRRTIGKNVEFKGTVDTITDQNAHSSDVLQESFSKNGKDMDLSIDGEKISLDVAVAQAKSQRSNSLTPPTPNFVHMSSSEENLNCDQHFVQKPRSFSLSSEHSLAQLKPMNVMLATTGSETRLDDLKSNNFGEHPGMSNVAQWLKGLRLHKYVWLFSNISYEQMMSMDEEYLQKLGVTKGARHKLLLSIKKLQERSALLESIERELRAGPPPPTVARLLEQLRAVLASPLAPLSLLPATIVRVLDLASITLLNGGAHLMNGPPLLTYPAYNHYEDHTSPLDQYEHAAVDPVSLHCWLVDKALHHEAFTCSQDLVDTLKKMRYRIPPRQFFNHLSDLPYTKRTVKPRWRVNGATLNGSLKPVAHKRPWVPPTREPRSKSSSYPLFPPPAPPAQRGPPTCAPNMSASLGDINSRLESLCLQMTEQAIN